MNPKEDFFLVIHQHFNSVIGNCISPELTYQLSQTVTDYYFDQYQRFYNQYPKSRKRYSVFDLKDMDHPSTYELVLNFFKKKDAGHYLKHSCIALGQTENEVLEFEKQREAFYKMF